MKGWIVNQIPEVGQLENEFQLRTDLPVPNPRDTQVLVKTLFSPIHIDGIHLAEGSFFGGIPFMLPSVSSKCPFILGFDVTGVVVKIGEKVTNLNEGDLIWGIVSPFREHQGSWAEFCCVEEKYTLKKPETIDIKSFAACCFSLYIACGAIEPLEQILNKRVEEGKKRILIVGVSGGIGSLISQILKQRKNVYIIGVCSGRNTQLVKEKHGVDEVIDYEKHHFKDILSDDTLKVDAVVDCVGGAEVEANGYKVLKSGGIFVTLTGPVAWIGDTRLSSFELSSVISGMLWRSIRNMWSTNQYFISNPSYKTLGFVKTLFEALTIDPEINRTISFEDKVEIVRAIKEVRSHHTNGKILIEMKG